MEKRVKRWEHNGYIMRNSRAEDAEQYYEDNFNPMDAEAAYLTGSKSCYSREEVIPFVRRCVDDPERYDFFIIAPDGRIVGESVINQIDWETRCANFRICLSHAEFFGQGLGTWIVRTTRDFAFEELHLHRLELDVFSFNPRAKHVYEKAGFRVEGVRRDAVLSREGYGDDILMAILEEEWRAL